MTNAFLNFFGVKTRKKEFKVVSTDYTSIAILYTCNDDSWWKSYDQYSINVRNVADASTAINNLTTNAQVFKLIEIYTKYDQVNPSCKQITVF